MAKYEKYYKDDLNGNPYRKKTNIPYGRGIPEKIKNTEHTLREQYEICLEAVNNLEESFGACSLMFDSQNSGNPNDKTFVKIEMKEIEELLIELALLKRTLKRETDVINNKWDYLHDLRIIYDGSKCQIMDQANEDVPEIDEVSEEDITQESIDGRTNRMVFFGRKINKKK